MQKRLTPFVSTFLTGCFILTGSLGLTACSDLQFPWVYRINIDQGNIITQDMVNQLKPGMTRSQVQYVMGTALINDTFHDDRWDYVYTLQDSKGKRKEQRLTVFFQDDKLSSINGDFMPEQAQTTN